MYINQPSIELGYKIQVFFVMLDAGSLSLLPICLIRPIISILYTFSVYTVILVQTRLTCQMFINHHNRYIYY
jgi:hypothetical protein